MIYYYIGHILWSINANHAKCVERWRGGKSKKFISSSNLWLTREITENEKLETRLSVSRQNKMYYKFLKMFFVQKVCFFCRVASAFNVPGVLAWSEPNFFFSAQAALCRGLSKLSVAAAPLERGLGLLVSTSGVYTRSGTD